MNVSRTLAIAPQVALFVIGFAVPAGALAATSLARVENFSLIYDLDLSTYYAVLASDLFWKALRGSLICAASGALVTCLSALPLTLYLTLYATRRMRLVVASSLLLPLLTNYVVRAYALKIAFSNQGLVNYLASLLGAGPFQLLYTPAAVVAGYFFYFTAFAVLAQWAGSGRLSPAYVQTAADLGASRWQTLAYVVLPLAARGIALQIVAVCAFVLSDTIIVQAIGGSSVFTMSTLLLDYFKVNDWPKAAATAVLVSAISVPLLTTSLWLGLRITRENQWEGVR